MKLLLLDRPEDKNIVNKRDVEFFGPWAQPIDYPEDLNEPRFEPYPTCESVYNASLRVMEQADNIFESLVKILPGLTGVNLTNRFWKFYLGDFIITLATTIEDIKIRHMALPEKEYILGLPEPGLIRNGALNSWKDAEEYMFRNDYFNWYVMEICLKDCFRNHELIKYEYIPFKRITKSFEDLCAKIYHRGYKQVFKKLGLYLEGSLVLAKRKGSLFNNSNSLIWDEYNLRDFDFRSLRPTRLFNQHLFGIKSPPSFLPDKKRRAIIKNSFPHPYGELLSAFLPLYALEGLSCLINLIGEAGFISKFRNIERIYTQGQAFNSDGLKRVLLALLAESGKRVVSIQHGGAAYIAHTGMYLERTVADEYISWGRGYSNYNELPKVNRIRSLPSIYLSNLNHKYLSKNKIEKWDILLLVLEEFRYVKWMYSALFADMAYDYYQRQKTLFDYFCNKKNTAVRIYNDAYGWKQAEWIKKKYPLAKILVSGHFVDQAVKTKIVLLDYYSTAFLEMLALNIPFLATWNRRWPKGTRLFEDFIDRLQETGIFYENPNTLLNFYEELKTSDIDIWWKENKRQEAIRKMAENFAMISDKFCEEWKTEFAKPG